MKGILQSCKPDRQRIGRKLIIVEEGEKKKRDVT